MNGTFIFAIKVLAPLAVIGAVVGIGLYAWDQYEDASWRELDVKWRRSLGKERRELRRLDREDELSARLRGEA